MINSRHILNLSIELIIKPQALLKGTPVARGWGDFQVFLKNSFLKSFKKFLKEF
jgi:hypothetical protein